MTVWQTESFFFQSDFWLGPPVAIPQSHRLFFFIFFNTFSTLNVSEHTTVPQTGVFFRHFTPGCPWPYHGLTDWVCGMVTDVHARKTDCKKNRSVRLWYSHWHVGSKVCWEKNGKNPVCETVVWSLMFRVESVLEKKNGKNLVCETVVLSLPFRVESVLEKRW